MKLLNLNYSDLASACHPETPESLLAGLKSEGAILSYRVSENQVSINVAPDFEIQKLMEEICMPEFPGGTRRVLTKNDL